MWSMRRPSCSATLPAGASLSRCARAPTTPTLARVPVTSLTASRTGCRQVVRFADTLVSTSGLDKGDPLALAVNWEDQVLVVKPTAKDQIAAYLKDNPHLGEGEP